MGATSAKPRAKRTSRGRARRHASSHRAAQDEEGCWSGAFARRRRLGLTQSAIASAMPSASSTRLSKLEERAHAVQAGDLGHGRQRALAEAERLVVVGHHLEARPVERGDHRALVHRAGESRAMSPGSGTSISKRACTPWPCRRVRAPGSAPGARPRARHGTPRGSSAGAADARTPSGELVLRGRRRLRRGQHAESRRLEGRAPRAQPAARRPAGLGGGRRGAPLRVVLEEQEVLELGAAARPRPRRRRARHARLLGLSAARAVAAAPPLSPDPRRPLRAPSPSPGAAASPPALAPAGRARRGIGRARARAPPPPMPPAPAPARPGPPLPAASDLAARLLARPAGPRALPRRPARERARTGHRRPSARARARAPTSARRAHSRARARGPPRARAHPAQRGTALRRTRTRTTGAAVEDRTEGREGGRGKGEGTAGGAPPLRARARARAFPPNSTRVTSQHAPPPHAKTQSQ